MQKATYAMQREERFVNNELFRGKVYFFNGKWGFVRSPFPKRWGGQDVLFHVDDGKFAVYTGSRTRFSNCHPIDPKMPLRMPGIGDDIIYQFRESPHGPRATRWCHSHQWHSPLTGYISGNITQINPDRFFAIAKFGDNQTTLVHPKNWRPVTIQDGNVSLDLKNGLVFLSTDRQPEIGDRIVFQFHREGRKVRAKPWTFEDDWAAASYNASQKP